MEFLRLMLTQSASFSFADATRKYIEAGKDLEGKGFDPRKLLAPGCEAIKETVQRRLIFWFSRKSLMMIGDFYE